MKKSLFSVVAVASLAFAAATFSVGAQADTSAAGMHASDCPDGRMDNMCKMEMMRHDKMMKKIHMMHMKKMKKMKK